MEMYLNICLNNNFNLQMCVRFRPKDRSCWKELDDNLLHF